MFFFGRPESYPGAHDDDGERDVDLEEVEAEGALEGELHEDHGPGDDMMLISMKDEELRTPDLFPLLMLTRLWP